MRIESNTETAREVASKIANTAEGIIGVSRPTKDSTSSYHGNNDAKSHIGYEADYNSQAAAKLQEFVSLVQSMAAEFEATDIKMSNLMSQPLYTPSAISGRAPLLTD